MNIFKTNKIRYYKVKALGRYICYKIENNIVYTFDSGKWNKTHYESYKQLIHMFNKKNVKELNEKEMFIEMLSPPDSKHNNVIYGKWTIQMAQDIHIMNDISIENSNKLRQSIDNDIINRLL